MDRSFGLLVRLFRDRLFEDDSAGPGSGFQTNIWQILGFLLAAGWFIAYFMTPQLLWLSADPASPQAAFTIFTLRMLFTSFSFAIVGFAAVFEWDTLFPDRRDFLILGTLPVTPWQMFAARLAALGSLLLLLVAAFNVFPIGMMVVLSLLVPSLHGLGWKLVLAQFAATTGAAGFALLAVAGLQGVLIHVFSPRLFRRVSPAIQMFGMSAMLLSVLLFPIYSLLLPGWTRANGVWPWLLPPVWFAGVYDLLVPSPVYQFAEYGTHALRMLAGALFVAAIGWLSGYARHYRRTLESEETHARTGRIPNWPAMLNGSEAERAISAFTFRTLASSNKHRLFLATYLSIGLAVAILFAVAVRGGRLTVSEDGLRAFPFVIGFFVVSGFRAVAQFPAELPANWLFRLAEAHWPEAARRATRKQALLCALVPAWIAVSPLNFVLRGWQDSMLDSVFQLLTGVLLIEAMFWSFDKVPFTCSYFPGRTNLSLLAGMYLYGFTTYSFHLATLERLLESSGTLAAIIFAAGAAVLALSWRRTVPATQIRFDGEEPLIRSLDLT